MFGLNVVAAEEANRIGQAWLAATSRRSKIELPKLTEAVMSREHLRQIEKMTQTKAAPAIKQHLTHLKMLLDWMVTDQIIPTNPEARSTLSHEGKHCACREDAKVLFDSIKPTQIVALRGRALIAATVYAVARVSAVPAMKVEEYYANGKKCRVKPHEKGGRFHEVPVHHKAEEHLGAYIEAAGLQFDKKGPLFRSSRGRSGKLTELALTRECIADGQATSERSGLDFEALQSLVQSNGHHRPHDRSQDD